VGVQTGILSHPAFCIINTGVVMFGIKWLECSIDLPPPSIVWPWHVTEQPLPFTFINYTVQDDIVCMVACYMLYGLRIESQFQPA